MATEVLFSAIFALYLYMQCHSNSLKCFAVLLLKVCS